MTYETSIKVRFADIDHGRVVYYPRISHYFHMTFEDFFADRTERDYRHVVDERRRGFPTVKSEVEYHEPLSYGDVLRVEMAVFHVGRASLGVRYRVRKEGSDAVCVEGRITTVCIDMDTWKPAPIPDDLREVFLGARAEE